MAFWLDLLVFVFGAFRRGHGLLAWFADPRGMETRRYAELRARGVHDRLRRNAVAALLTGTTSLYAAVWADLGWLWAVLAAADYAGAAVLLLVSRFGARRAGTATAPLTPEHLDRLVASRRRGQRIRLLLLVLWIVSWRRLLV